ncbi:transcriptional regulator [Pseudomonas sp. GM33]|uniref:MltR family transcriptional regulator n=1 Tax=Pseudomonas sp. GM33 TaxID=1144329 RepID=UPI00027022FC|nr:MltR family transcriptional regulator [Pseudomonas sp. GM33]EJM44839.1 transcriptional regulator [Pseudomonas sp. GM33]
MEGNDVDTSDLLEDEVYGSFNALGPLLDEQDDRGLVLSLAAFAEEALGKLLKAFLLPVATSSQLVGGFGAPLGNFSSRIKAAYSLGLVTKNQFDDLEQLRKIRNLFAHTWQRISLEDQRVSGHIRSMNYASYLQAYPETAEEKLRSSGYALLLALTGLSGTLANRGGGVTAIGGEIFFGFSGDFNDQIKAAKEDFLDISNRMQTASGEALSFYRQVLIRLHARTQYLKGADSDADEKAILMLRTEILERAASAK